MAKGRRAMEFIPMDKSRKLTFRNRSTGLKKKIEELATLCGIDACLIIYDRSSPDGCQPEPQLWPSNRQHLHSIINRCGQRQREGKKQCIKTSDGVLVDDLEKPNKETMKEQVSVRGNYTWDDEPIIDLSGEQLKQLLTACESKFEFVKSRAGFLRKRMNRISPERPAPMIINPNCQPVSGTTPSTTEFCFAPPTPDSALPAPTTIPDINLHYHQNVAAPLQWVPVMVGRRPSSIHQEFFL